jgi:hypothetical protein
MRRRIIPVRTLSALAVGAAALFVSEYPLTRDFLVSQAEARIGRPLTPMSYAGVARRTTRRAVVATGAVGVAAGAYYAAPGAPGCYQAVDAYGRVYWRCP